MRDGQHRNAGLPILLRPVECERPEVRWRPEEDDQPEQHRLRADLAAHRDPSEQRRHRAGSAADHDVLRRARLEHHGIDQGIADKGGQRQPQRQQVHRSAEKHAACTAKGSREKQCLADTDLAARGRSPRGAAHSRVDAAFHYAVDRSSGRCHQPDAGRRGEQPGPMRQARFGEKHPDHGAEDDELDDAWLGQCMELPRACKQRGLRGRRSEEA